MYNFFFFFWLRVGVPKETGHESKKKREDEGCTLSFFCLLSRRPAAQLDSQSSLMWAALWRSSPRPVKHCSHFPIVAGHEERYSRAKESFQFTLGLCLCLHNCACLLWVEIRQCALNFNIPSLTELFNLLSCNGQNLFEFFPLFWASVTLILLIQLYKRIKLKATEVDVNVCCKIPFQIFFLNCFIDNFWFSRAALLLAVYKKI